ncbi:MAG TPA: twin-arginine translocase TatA/TatE family subunit [bacterium]|nr:twin-arginine translocase TatA/TatE family subunit [bacterium]HQG45096.1 twin-arginine translocase TatA/TatE family subunit [bacterium]HQI49779.1 twin-arginine translocase TatA/TatE family subunit [bacterium]HQJ64951.1 twin-arginine translocase TatA/TatE family subunit [bacterium]
MGIGPTEWLIIIFLVVLLFGSKKIPELAKGLGQGIKEFKKAANDINDSTSHTSSQDELPPADKKQG